MEIQHSYKIPWKRIQILNLIKVNIEAGVPFVSFVAK